MAADVPQFSQALDKVYKTFSTQEVQFEQKEMRGLGDRDALQYMERKYQQQLQRARAAFLQEFRNHSVVVESEVRRIREELTARMEERYGERIRQLKDEAAEAVAVVQKHKDEASHLKSLAVVQESYLAATRHRWGFEVQERLTAEVARLKAELEAAKKECADLAHQLVCRDELVAQLNQELGGLDGELRRQALAFADERRILDEQLRASRNELFAQQEQFHSHLREYEERFEDYRSKSSTQLQIQAILNERRAAALRDMEDERQRHVKARTKPTPRIGSASEADRELPPEVQFQDYQLEDARYRVDNMGMDTSWRDYELNDLQLAHTRRKAQPLKFRVERIRQATQRGAASLGPNAPVATETPRPVLHVHDLQAASTLPPVPPARGRMVVAAHPGVLPDTACPAATI